MIMKKLLRVLLVVAALLVSVGCREKTTEEKAADALKGASKDMKETAEKLNESADETLKDLTGE